MREQTEKEKQMGRQFVALTEPHGQFGAGRRKGRRVEMETKWTCEWCGWPGDPGIDKAFIPADDDGKVFCGPGCATTALIRELRAEIGLEDKETN